MSGHTPGPWVVEPKPYSQFYIQITGGDLKTITSLHAGGLRNKPQQHKNARLIAAAPDLLAALERLVRQHGSDGIEYGGDHPIAVARAAIAKATGEAT